MEVSQDIDINIQFKFINHLNLRIRILNLNNDNDDFIIVFFTCLRCFLHFSSDNNLQCNQPQ